MNLGEFVEEVNGFFMDHSGVIGRALTNYSEKKPKPISSLFFTPFRSVGDGFLRTSELVTAPVFLAVIALETAITGFCLLVKSIYDLISGNPGKAAENLGDGMGSLVYSFISSIAAVLAPLVTLIDLVGSAVATGKNDAVVGLKI